MQPACKKPSTAVCCISRRSSSGSFNPLSADDNFSAGDARFGTTLPSPPEGCARSCGIRSVSRCFSVMPSVRTVSGSSDRSSSSPSAGFPKQLLSVLSPPDDSGSVQGSGDEHDGFPRCQSKLAADVLAADVLAADVLAAGNTFAELSLKKVVICLSLPCAPSFPNLYDNRWY